MIAVASNSYFNAGLRRDSRLNLSLFLFSTPGLSAEPAVCSAAVFSLFLTVPWKTNYLRIYGTDLNQIVSVGRPIAYG